MPVPTARSTASVRPWLACFLIVGAMLLAWGNSFSGPFVFDDYPSIVDNASIRRLGSFAWLRPPATAGETVSGRPVLNFTFAANHALGGLDVRGYHVVNLGIHALAALVLFGIVRRTPSPGGPAASPQQTFLAVAVALLWAVHPLQVESVTYVVQRAESLGGLFCLLTLYAFIRGAEAEKGRSRRRWFGVAVASCLVGVGTKETVVVMPVVVLLWDRTFLAGNFITAWRARGRMHAALFATWLPLAVMVLGIGGTRGGTFSFTVEGFWLYWLAQCKAVVWYLRLVAWPQPLVFDRAFFRLTPVEALPYAAMLIPLVGATLWGLWRRTAAGFAGACFFIFLAPSSLMPGLFQVIVEHRMYLALAPLLALLAALLRAVRPRVGLAVVAVTAMALGTTTFVRNQVYHSSLSLWADTAEKAPDNPRAQYNLGLAYRELGRNDEAVAAFQRALALNPRHAYAHFELGKLALVAGRWSEAADAFSSAVAADPHYVNARVNLGQALVHLGRTDEAVAQYRMALADEPAAADIATSLATLLVRQGGVAEGIALLREVLARDPASAGAHYQLGLALVKSGSPAAAEAEFHAALQSPPVFAAEVWFELGNLLAQQERIAEAAAAFTAALERDPSHALARASLANCQLLAGQFDAAIANYEAVLRVRPGDTGVRRNLELARDARRAGR